MTSIRSKAVERILKSLNLKRSYERAFESGKFGKGDVNDPPKKLYEHLDIEHFQSKERNVFSLKPKNCQSSTYILYLHGGGYLFGFNTIHWKFIDTLVQALNCTFIAPDYPVAPRFTVIDSFEMVLPIYKDLANRVGGEKIILMGDSAGGGFALALAQKIKEDGIEQPCQIILLSPWLDITLQNPEIIALDSEDPILGIHGLRLAGEAYAGGLDLSNYLLSPINGNFEGLGKISIFMGTKDILLADARKLIKIAEGKGIHINYYEYEEMVHVWLIFDMPESKKAIEQIDDLVNK